jgi:hypothetical protein
MAEVNELFSDVVLGNCKIWIDRPGAYLQADGAIRGVSVCVEVKLYECENRYATKRSGTLIVSSGGGRVSVLSQDSENGSIKVVTDRGQTCLLRSLQSSRALQLGERSCDQGRMLNSISGTRVRSECVQSIQC